MFLLYNKEVTLYRIMKGTGIFTIHFRTLIQSLGFPGGSDSKESTCDAGDLGSIPGLRRSPGGGHGSPLQ